MTTTDSQKADTLSKFFQSVFIIEDVRVIPNFPPKNYVSELSIIDITEDMVAKELSSINTKKSAGPDGINPRVLCECANTLAPYITKLFQQCA